MLGESDGSGKITEEEAESVKESEGQDTCCEVVSCDYDREATPLEFKKYYALNKGCKMTVQVNVLMWSGDASQGPISVFNPSMADERGKKVFSRKAMVFYLIVVGHPQTHGHVCNTK